MLASQRLKNPMDYCRVIWNLVDCRSTRDCNTQGITEIKQICRKSLLFILILVSILTIMPLVTTRPTKLIYHPMMDIFFIN